MKITRLGPTIPILNSSTLGSSGGTLVGGTAGTVPTANGSNGWSWASNVARITSNGSNTVAGPYVNFAAGSNMTFAVTSNTLTIYGSAGTVSAGSNSTRVSEISSAGVSTTLWSPYDHQHNGIGTITASSSNTMQRGTWNIRPGSGIALSLTDTDGDGEFDTTTIVATGAAAAGGGGASTAHLAVKAYAPGSDTSVGTTTSTTFVDLDATNAAITFTAPASGNVIVRLTGLQSGSGGPYFWGLREASSNIGTPVRIGDGSVAGSGAVATFYLTGISSGSHTYKWSHCVTGSTCGVYGGPTWGQIVMEVISA